MRGDSSILEMLKDADFEGRAVVAGDPFPYDPNINIIELFYSRLDRFQDRIALSYHDRSCTYKELNERSNQLGRLLQENGIEKGHFVPMILDKHIEADITIFGILKSSAAYIPVDPQNPDERIEYILKDSQAKCLITESRHLRKLERIIADAGMKMKIFCVDVVFGHIAPRNDECEYYDISDISRCSSENVETKVSPMDRAYVIYTSGTTGKPKGVVNVHSSIVNMAAWCLDFLELNESWNFLQLAALTFDVSVAEIFPPLLSGGHLHIVPVDQKQSPEDLFNLIDEYRVGLLALPPALIYQLDEIFDPGTETRFSTVKVLISGGEKLLLGRIKNFLKLSGNSDFRVLNVYGPTETTVLSTALWVDPEDERTVGLLGKPIYNEQVYIVNEEMKLCNLGETGEILIGGDGVAECYLNDSIKSDAAFIENPFVKEGGLNRKIYRTGDLGRILPDGNIEFVGRRDEQVKVRGFRIELGEIESVLGRHPGVKHAVVLAQEDEGGHKRLVAYILPETDTGEVVTTNELREHILSELPEFMMPGYFMFMDSFPLNQNGKVDRKKLPPVEKFTRQDDGDFEAPESEMESEVAKIWSDLLKVDRVGRNDNFFSLGGDSIISIQVISRLNRLGYKVKSPQLFKYPTLKEFSASISQGKKSAGKASVVGESPASGKVTGPVMLSPIMSWFVEKDFQYPDFWHQSLEFEVRDEISPEIVARVMDILVDQHDMLRCRITKTRAGVHQIITPDVPPVKIYREDLSGLSAEDRERVLHGFCNNLRSAIRLKEPPMMRVGLVKLDENLYHFIWIIHHTIVDTVSWKLLLDHFHHFYNMIQSGAEIVIPERTTSFPEYSLKLYETLFQATTRKKLDEEFRYWKKFLKDTSYRAPLPLDFPDENLTHDAADHLSIDLDEEMTGYLVNQAHNCYNTRMPDLLLAALYRVLSRWMKSESIVVQLEGHGRDRDWDLDLTETVGWFTALYPFFLRIQNGESFADTIIKVKEERNKIPDKGNNFLLLRYGGHDPEVEEAFAGYKDPDIVFNYHGRFDAGDVTEKWKSLSATGSNFHPDNKTPYTIGMECWIWNEQLHLEIIHSKYQFKRDTIQNLANGFMIELHSIIEHCLNPLNRTLTPSDFPLAELTMEEVRQLPGGYEDVYQLSSMQNGMMLQYLLNPNTRSYHIQTVYAIEEKIDVSLMSRAFNALVEKYSILRTIFPTEGYGNFVQIVMPHSPLEIECIDLTGQSREDQDQYLLQFQEEDLKRPFDLSTGPLVRVKFFKYNENSYRLSWGFHHIILDGWSYGMLRHEWLSLYATLVRGESLPELKEKGTFKDFIENHAAQSKDPESLEFWQEKVSDFKRLTLPTDYPRKRDGESTVRSLREDLSPELLNELKDFSTSTRLTFNEIFISAYLLLLHILCNESDVSVGFVVSGRAPDLNESESIAGNLINSVPFRITVEENQTFLEMVNRVHTSLLDVREHENFPLSEIVALSDMAHEAGRGLFDCLFDYEKYPDETRAPGMPEISIIGGFEVTEYELTLQIIETDKLTVQFSYIEELFERSTLKRWYELYMKLVRAIIAGPGEIISGFERLTETDKEFIAETNRTQAVFPESETLMSLFEKSVRQYSDRPALIMNGESITYDRFNRRINQLAHHLRELGVGTDRLVAILCERSFDMMVGIYAVLKAGGAYIPVDAENPDHRIQYLLEDSGSEFVLTLRKYSEKISNNVHMVYLDDESIYSGSDENPEMVSDPNNLAYCIYTSGTTGKPKGVLIEHRSAVNLVSAMQKRFPVVEGDVFLQRTRYTFDASIAELYGWFHEGGSLALLPSDREKDPVKMLQTIRDEKVTHAQFVPSLLQVVLDHVDESNRDALHLLKYVFAGGEAVTTGLMKRLWENVPDSTVFGNVYGPTECTVDATVHTMKKGDGSEMIPIGRPMENVNIYILDHNGQMQPVGVPGELCIAGVGLARGYLNRPALNEEKFVDSRFEPGLRIYHTGDLARLLRDGTIEYLGRIDHQVKIRGYRIEPGEVENILQESDKVAQCLVLAQDSETRGKYLAAYVVPSNPGDMIEDRPTVLRKNLESYLKATLPEYMIPSAFVFLKSFPLTPNGKVDRRALPDPEWSGDEEYVAPGTPQEKMLAEIWSEVLKTDRIGIHDNFFSLGGHSLLATQVVSRIRQKTGVDFPLQAIFTHPVLEEMAPLISGPVKKERVHIPRVERGGAYPLSFAQQRVWFIEEMLTGKSPYHIPITARLTGKLDEKILKESIRDLMERHESLRTRIIREKGEGVQIIEDDVELNSVKRDLRESDPVERENSLMKLVREDSEQPFDLSEAPLFRVYLYHVDADDTVLQILMHHIITDGWSMGVMLNELFSLYTAKVNRDQQFELVKHKIDYVDFAVWQREFLKGEELDRQLSYWKTTLGGELPVLEMPTDRNRPKIQGHEGSMTPVSISGDKAKWLKEAARKEDGTVFMALLAVYYILLYRYTGQTDLIVGTPIANRNRGEIEEIIGFFVNTLALRVRLDKEMTFREVLRQVREISLDAYDHQDIPFEKIVEELHVERDMSRNPVFQALFVLQNAPFPELNLPSLNVERYEFDTGMSHFDLIMSLEEMGDEIHGFINFSTTLFDESRMRSLGDHFNRIVDSIVSNPDEKIGKLDLLTSDEYRTLTVQWNETENPLPRIPDSTMAEGEREEFFLDLFEKRAKEYADQKASICGGQFLTYSDLDRLSDRIAGALKEIGVSRNDFVGILMGRSHEAPAAMLGIWKAGCAYLPIDPAYPEERIQVMLEETGATVILSQNDILTEIVEKIDILRDKTILTLDELREDLKANGEPLSSKVKSLRGIEEFSASVDPQSRSNRSDDPAYIIYTSGTTGKPKGIINTHGNVSNLIHWTLTGLPFVSGEVVTQFASYSFDVSVAEFYPGLSRGSSIVILTQEQRGSLVKYLEALKEYGVTWTSLPPALLYQLLDLIEEDESKKEYFSTVKTVICGGDALLSREVERWQNLFGDKPAILNVYGPTETTVLSTAYFVPYPVDRERPVVILGNPIDNTKIYILDSNDNLCPVSVVGEICISGAGVANGYINDLQKNAEKFIRDPFSKEPLRLYRTGDLGRRLSDGSIEFMGRVDHQVKIRGFRVEPAEIETVLIEHESVREAAVVARDDEGLGKRLVAYFTTEEMTEEETGELIDRIRAYLKQALPEYMVPSAFMRLIELPLTHNGKVNLKALPAPDWQVGRTYTAPRNEMEKKLASIWAEVLQVEKVGVHDNFFEIGGHSILVIQLHEQLTRELNVDLPVAQIFQYPTIHSIVEYLGKGNEQMADILKDRPTMETRKKERNVRRDERRKRNRGR